ncbi:hypothetical protein Clacol_005958 [Clathrus columnatus]|uniref:Phosphosulfolactate synthase n=1 Tax=Clathrus columnatus TaxID=1419009 RepID=A0AAV5AGV9_9AGAM|nr:hypothetical protein Clacol_005958 [Clathrus columnatus]
MLHLKNINSLSRVSQHTLRSTIRYGHHQASGDHISPTSPGGFNFIASNPLPPKPRLESGKGITEIRGPYYNAAFGPAVLEDTLKISGAWVDGLKFAGGGFTLMPADVVKEITDVAHKHNVYVSTGGFIERILATSNDRTRDVQRYVRQCKNLGFDVVELSTGFLSLPVNDWAELVQCVRKESMKAKPELGIQWGAGGDAAIEDLEEAGTSDVGALIDTAKVLLDAGADMLMIESEGITENVNTWRTDVLSSITHGLPLDKLMFEAADPKVFECHTVGLLASRNMGDEQNVRKNSELQTLETSELRKITHEGPIYKFIASMKALGLFMRNSEQLQWDVNMNGVESTVLLFLPSPGQQTGPTPNLMAGVGQEGTEELIKG